MVIPRFDVGRVVGELHKKLRRRFRVGEGFFVLRRGRRLFIVRKFNVLAIVEYNRKMDESESLPFVVWVPIRQGKGSIVCKSSQEAFDKVVAFVENPEAFSSPQPDAAKEGEPESTESSLH